MKDDWLMIEEYAKQKSIFGCILCDKTHSRFTCEHKAKRTAPPPLPEKKHNTDDDYGGNYSWYD